MFKKTIHSFIGKDQEELKAFAQEHPEQLNKDTILQPIPLLTAIKKEHIESLETLIELEIKNKSAAERKVRLQRAFAFSLQNFKISSVEKLLEYREYYDINAVNQFHIVNGNHIRIYPYTPLIWSTFQNKRGLCQMLIDAGANTETQLPDGTKAIYYAKTPRMQVFYQEIKDKKAIDQSARTSYFALENPYLVSHTERADICGAKLTTLFNFKYKTITYLGEKDDVKSRFVESFAKASSKEYLTDAVTFLVENNGDLCGFKLPAII